MTSPFTIPAFAAGDDGTTATTWAPGTAAVDGADVPPSPPGDTTTTPRKAPRPSGGSIGGAGAAAPFRDTAGALVPHTL